MLNNLIILGIPFWAIAGYVIGGIIGIILILPHAIAGLTDCDLGESPWKKKKDSEKSKKQDDDIPWEKYR